MATREDIIQELMRQYGDPNAQFGPADGGAPGDAPGGTPGGTPGGAPGGAPGGGMTFGGLDTSLTGDAYTGGYGNLGGGPLHGIDSPQDLGPPNTGRGGRGETPEEQANREAVSLPPASPVSFFGDRAFNSPLPGLPTFGNFVPSVAFPNLPNDPLTLPPNSPF